MCIKISENPVKRFFTIAGWTKLQNEYIFEPYVTQAFFCPRSWNFFHGNSCFLGHPNVHVFVQPKKKKSANSYLGSQMKTTLKSTIDKVWNRPTLTNFGYRGSTFISCIMEDNRKHHPLMNKSYISLCVYLSRNFRNLNLSKGVCIIEKEVLFALWYAWVLFFFFKRQFI